VLENEQIQVRPCLDDSETVGAVYDQSTLTRAFLKPSRNIHDSKEFSEVTRHLKWS